MKAYTSFAECYDMFMDEIEYLDWYRFIWRKLADIDPDIEEQAKRETAVELACGTGNFLMYLLPDFREVIGIDSSTEMLRLAQRKVENYLESVQETAADIHLMEMDMRDLELEQKAKYFFSICDSLNYILEPTDLAAVFGNVCKNMTDDGVFVFDMKSPELYRYVFADHTFGDNREEGGLIWENYWDEEEQLNEYALSLFMPEENGLYRKFEEVHYQRGYELEELIGMLGDAGFGKIEVYNDYGEEPADEYSHRFVFIVRK